MKGYGELIRRARIEEGLDAPEDLARLLINRKTGKAYGKAMVYRLESEKQAPDMDMVNQLAARLPLTVTNLLKAMGAHVEVDPSTDLQKPLRELLPLLNELRGREFDHLEAAALGQLELRRRRGGPP